MTPDPDNSSSSNNTEPNENTATPPRERISQTAVVTDALEGLRFDQIAAQLFPEFSRGKLKQWITSGALTVDGKQAKPRQKLYADSRLSLEAEFEVQTNWQPEALALDIIFEDPHVLVINKPHGLVVHPASGISSGTLANAVLAHCPGNAELPRCGIVHRLDKDTTGLLVIAKSLTAHASLVSQLQARTVSREYRAVVCGKLISGGTVDVPIGRHLTHRTKMAAYLNGVNAQNTKQAITHYRIENRFTHYTEVAVKLETGRTHQIRVHMAHIRHPLFGDATYNSRYKRPAGIDEKTNEQLLTFKRQALHAYALSFIHPESGEDCYFKSELPSDYCALINTLKQTP